MAKRPYSTSVHVGGPLANVSIAYRNPNYIAAEIFPVVPVQKQSDEYFVFDKASWFRNEAGPRAPGTIGPVVDYALSSSSYSCRMYSATKIVPDEVRDNADAPLKPLQEAIEFATDKVLLYMEYDVASEIMNNGAWSGSATPSPTWDNDGSSFWDDFETGRETVVAAIGREPNTFLMGRNVWTDLKKHPEILGSLGAGERGIITPQVLAQLLEVDKVLIGNAIYTSSAEGTTASYSYVWGKHAILAWVPPNPGLMVPAAGYTFTWKNRETKRFRRDEEGADSFRVQVSYDAVVTSADAGYEFKSCVA